MGAAASSGSDTTDLAASVESWVTSGGAAAIAALEAASPALAAALRSADADAVRGAGSAIRGGIDAAIGWGKGLFAPSKESAAKAETESLGEL